MRQPCGVLDGPRLWPSVDTAVGGAAEGLPLLSEPHLRLRALRWGDAVWVAARAVWTGSLLVQTGDATLACSWVHLHGNLAMTPALRSPGGPSQQVWPSRGLRTRCTRGASSWPTRVLQPPGPPEPLRRPCPLSQRSGACRMHVHLRSEGLV